MASTDNLEDVTAFAELNDANFPILSDESKSVSKSFGVLGISGYAKRWTFYIDNEGIIREIDRAVRASTAGADLGKNLERLGFK